MIEQIRTYPSDAELALLYRYPNDGDVWPEHEARIDLTVAIARSRFDVRDLIIDPAAGAGRTARELAEGVAITGDLSPDALVSHPGTTAEALLGERGAAVQSGAAQRANLVILGEILEHVDDPGLLLRLAAVNGAGLVLSTPLDEPAGVNPEHVWRWDKSGIEELLVDNGWTPRDYIELDYSLPHWPAGFRCQIHTAEAGK